MNLKKRIELLCAIGEYLKNDSEAYRMKRNEAYAENIWFVPSYVYLAGSRIAEQMLRKDVLEQFAEQYKLKDAVKSEKQVGVVMAGNIPYVGFHDLLCVFLAGHRQKIKLSSKDSILTKMLLELAVGLEPETADWIMTAERLNDCDAFIATGTDNSARYFEYYFSRVPHLIRKDRTSIAILTGKETEEQLEGLADDIQLYFGLGCRNVTKICVPEGYDFLPLLNVLKKYDHHSEHDKYKNNYDYQLTIAILNKKFYMTNGSIVLIEDDSPFSPISQLHYSYYKDKKQLVKSLDQDRIQCIVGEGQVPFGKAQMPGISDFPDGVDSMSFLMSL